MRKRRLLAPLVYGATWRLGSFFVRRSWFGPAEWLTTRGHKLQRWLLR